MDPQQVLDAINMVREFIAEYGSVLYEYAKAAIYLIVHVVTSFPGWVMDVWHFVSSIVKVLLNQIGL